MLVAPNGTSSISSIGASAGVAIGECGGTPAKTPLLSTYLFVCPKPVLANDVYHCGILREKFEGKSLSAPTSGQSFWAPRFRLRACETTHLFFECFPYVCPEPVWANVPLLVQKGFCVFPDLGDDFERWRSAGRERSAGRDRATTLELQGLRKACGGAYQGVTPVAVAVRLCRHVTFFILFRWLSRACLDK